MPIVSSNHVFVHMPKTGGCWVSGVLMSGFGGQLEGPSHAPVTVLPRSLREGRTTFGVLRSPWSWYESWYLHCRVSQRGLEALRGWGSGSVEFADVMAGVTRPGDVGELPRDFGGVWRFEPDEADPRDALLGTRAAGLWSCLLAYYGFLDPGVVGVLLDFENLRTALEQLVGKPLEQEMHPPENTRVQREPRDAANTVPWDPARRQRVADADGKAWRHALARCRQAQSRAPAEPR